jgi:DNA-binding transcriptional ArsR family regulator
MCLSHGSDLRLPSGLYLATVDGLKEAGLVEVRRDGLNIYYRVIRPEIFGVMDAMRAVTGKRPTVASPKRNVCTCPNCTGEHEVSLIQT